MPYVSNRNNLIFFLKKIQNVFFHPLSRIVALVIVCKYHEMETQI